MTYMQGRGDGNVPTPDDPQAIAPHFTGIKIKYQPRLTGRKMKYQIITQATPDQITQKLMYGFEEIYTEILTLREQQVRQALINLGWTPPNEEPNGHIQ